MSVYVVSLHVDGIIVKVFPESDSMLDSSDIGNSDLPFIGGFYTTRTVWSKTKATAIKKIKSMILKDWATGKYANINTGSSFRIEVEDVYKISIWTWITNPFPNKGYIFYSEDQ